jgi:hypothetical protein
VTARHTSGHRCIAGRNSSALGEMSHRDDFHATAFLQMGYRSYAGEAFSDGLTQITIRMTTTQRSP